MNETLKIKTNLQMCLLEGKGNPDQLELDSMLIELLLVSE